MSRFFVGQRVLLARPYYPQNAGKTGRIRGFCEVQMTFGGIGDCLVDWDDGDRDGCTGRDGFRHWTASHQLEPIQPSGAAPSEYSFTELMDRCRAGEGVSA